MIRTIKAETVIILCDTKTEFDNILCPGSDYNNINIYSLDIEIDKIYERINNSKHYYCSTVLIKIIENSL